MGTMNFLDEYSGKELPNLLVYGLLPLENEASPFLMDRPKFRVDVQLM